MITIFGASDTGLVRAVNQDRLAYRALSGNLAYAVVCDGMGGENGGHVASGMAADYVVAALERELNEEQTELSLRSVLLSAVAGANALVYDAAQKDGNLAGMGTTMIIAVFLNGSLYIAYVGDSRVYCVSNEQELQLTKDHTVVQMLVDIGEITEEDAKTHPKRHFITRAVGVGQAVEADFLVHKPAPGSFVLLCSDGLYNYLAPGSLYELLGRCAREESAAPLIGLALAGGGGDNVTAVVISIGLE